MRQFCMATAMAALLLSYRGVAEASLYEDVVLADNPVGYWRFEDGDVTSPAANTATSGAMLDGSYLGDGLALVPNSWAFLGTAVSLDGIDDYVEVPDHDLLDVTSAFSLEGWMSTSNPGTWGRLMDKRHSSGYALNMQQSTGRISTYTSLGNVQGGTLVADGRWHHVVATYDSLLASEGMKIYVDGVLDGTADLFGEIAVNDDNLTFGLNRTTLASGDGYGGLLDELAIYDRALDAAEILEHYEARFSGALTWDGTDSNWSFVETTGAEPDSHWDGGATLAAIPDVGTMVTINGGIVAVDAAAVAQILEVTAGEVMINSGRSLTIGAEASFAEGATLELGQDAAFSASSGSIPAVATTGNATLGTGGQLDVTGLNAGPGTLTKQGTGTLRLKESAVTAGPAVVFQVEEGTLAAAGENPLDEATQLTLAGGTFSVQGRFVVSDSAANDPLIHYAFDTVSDGVTENSGTGGADFDGLVSGPVTADNGVRGGALDFGGGKVVTANQVPMGEQYTVSLWLNSTAPQPLPWARIVLNHSFQAGSYLGGNAANSRFQVIVADNQAVVGGEINNNPDAWQHVVATHDGTAASLYVDGELVAGPIDMPGPVAATDWISVGNNWGDRDEGWRGLIDEVYIFDRALTSDEMAALLGTADGLDMSAVDLTVTADSTLRLSISGDASFGSLALQSGTLATAGTADVVSFAETTIDAADGAVVGIDTQMPVALGTINVVNATPLSFIKTGPLDLVLDQESVNWDHTTFDVREGRLIGIEEASNPFSAAALRLDGGEVVFAAKNSGDALVFDNQVDVVSNSVLTAGKGDAGADGPATVGIGGTNGVAVYDGSLTLRSADQYQLDVAGAISGAGKILVDEGEVVLSGGGEIASMSVSGGSLRATAPITANSLTVSGGRLSLTADLTANSIRVSGGQIDAGPNHLIVGEKMVLGQTTFSIDAGNTFAAGGSDLLAGGDLTLSGGTLTVFPNVLVPAGALIYYAFDSTEGDQTPNGGEGGADFDGVLSGDVEADAGKVGDALNFNGGKVVTKNQVPLEQEYTVSIWVNSPELQPVPWARIVLNHSYQNGSYLGGDGPNGQYQVIVAGNFDVVGGEINNDPEVWQHLVATYDGTDARLYIDGELAVGPIAMNPPASATDWIGIGNNWGDRDEGWRGLIDEVYIYDTAIDQDDVTALFEAGNALPGATAVHRPATNLLVTDDTTLALQSQGDAVFGNLKLASGVSLRIDGTAASFQDISSEGDATLDGIVLARGTISPGDGIGTLTIDGELEMASGEDEGDAVYLAELGGAAGDLIVATSDIFLGGTLTLQAVGSLESVGDATHTILRVESEEGEIVGEFDAAPAPGDHLGHGVFHRSLEYSPDWTTLAVEVFQAAAGDTDGDQEINNGDLQQILAAGSFNSPGDWQWGQGDFNGDGLVNNGDLQLILATGHFGAGPYAANVAPAGAGLAVVPEPGAALLLATGVLGLLLWRRFDFCKQRT